MHWQRKSSQLQDALMAIIWQLAESDKAFQKFAVDELRKVLQGSRSAIQLWNGLISVFCKRPSRGILGQQKVIFLVIDGNDELMDGTDTADTDENCLGAMVEDAKEICGNPEYSCHVRILFSSEPEPEPGGRDEEPRKVEIQLPQDSRHFDAEIFIHYHLADLYRISTEETDGYRVIWSLQKRLTSMFGKGSNYYVLIGFL